ncbi:MAG: methyltransferase domain-containing protein [Chloroflexota bacterium]|nr:methyltransferase domain-containing protein [Chloroflexota bacterium]
MEEDIIAAGYDAVFAATPNSPTLRRLWREHACGRDFPEQFGHVSFVTLAELRRFADELRLSPGDTLVNLACGMGGPALWLANETGARVIGIDLSAVGVALAAERAAQLGLAERSRFAVGSFAQTGLPDASADAISSEDALQYAPDKRASFAEAARILRPRGRLVFSAFELEPERVAGLPVLGTDPVSDYRPLLEAAGFDVDVYDELPGVPQPLTGAYTALLDARETLIREMGEPAAMSLFGELTLTLERRPYRRRVLARGAKI